MNRAWPNLRQHCGIFLGETEENYEKPQLLSVSRLELNWVSPRKQSRSGTAVASFLGDNALR